jgi:hypothetical protein
VESFKEFPNVKCFNIDLPDDQGVEHLSDEVLTRSLPNSLSHPSEYWRTEDDIDGSEPM